MTRQNVDAWIPEDWDSKVYTKIIATSAIEALATRVPMTTDNKHLPRSAGVGINVTPKGQAYVEDTLTDDEIVLTVRKLTRLVRLAEEDLDDLSGFIDVLNVKKQDWAGTYARFLDNACLGVTAAENGTTIPYTSLYNRLTTTDATTSYTANANRVQSATATALTYDDFNNTLGLLEQGDYYDESNLIVIAHPYYKKAMRGIKDTAGIPIFEIGRAGIPSTLFGLPISWSIGAKTHATASAAPTGNPLLFFGNREHLLLGVRSGPESVVIDGRSGVGALTDETLLKLRARRAFGTVYPQAFAVLEDIP
jgi:HK97 family phage major capsid protein